MSNPCHRRPCLGSTGRPPGSRAAADRNAEFHRNREPLHGRGFDIGDDRVDLAHTRAFRLRRRYTSLGVDDAIAQGFVGANEALLSLSRATAWKEDPEGGGLRAKRDEIDQAVRAFDAGTDAFFAAAVNRAEATQLPRSILTSLLSVAASEALTLEDKGEYLTTTLDPPATTVLVIPLLILEQSDVGELWDTGRRHAAAVHVRGRPLRRAARVHDRARRRDRLRRR